MSSPAGLAGPVTFSKGGEIITYASSNERRSRDTSSGPGEVKQQLAGVRPEIGVALVELL